MALSHAILTAIIDKPLSGYDLAKRFDASIGFFWQATHQQIYLELSKMERAGLLAGKAAVQTSRRTRILYSVTPAGIANLLEWARSETDAAVIKDDILVKCHALGVLSGYELRSHILHRRAHHRSRLENYRATLARHYPDPRALSGSALGQYLSLRAGIRYENAWLDWADEACILLPLPETVDQLRDVRSV